MFEAVLDGLDLHGHGREHRLLQAVELIKAAPSSTLHQAHEDATHGLHVNALVDRQTHSTIIDSGFYLFNPYLTWTSLEIFINFFEGDSTRQDITRVQNYRIELVKTEKVQLKRMELEQRLLFRFWGWNKFAGTDLKSEQRDK